jgi:putative CocE/NonD family hydrolase
VLLIGGWQDLFINQTVAQYEHLRGRGSDVAMTIGPWTHRQMVGKAGGTVIQESLDWLNTHLAGADSGRVAPVRVFVTGQEWQTLSSWPPPTTHQVLHLGPGGGLAAAPPPTAAAPSTFRYAPTDPTPTVGGRLLAAQGGYRDDTTLGHRADVLSFTTEPLAEDLCVFGRPVVELCHGSDNPNVDLFVRVSEVDAQGRSRNVSDGYLRLIAPQDPQVVRIELDTIAHRFAAGSRIRLLVAGGSHPRFARNTGTGEPPVTARRLVPANHVVHHGQGGISRLVLPASVPGTDGRQASDPSSRT